MSGQEKNSQVDHSSRTEKWAPIKLAAAEQAQVSGFKNLFNQLVQQAGGGEFDIDVKKFQVTLTEEGRKQKETNGFFEAHRYADEAPFYVVKITGGKAGSKEFSAVVAAFSAAALLNTEAKPGLGFQADEKVMLILQSPNFSDAEWLPALTAAGLLKQNKPTP